MKHNKLMKSLVIFLLVIVLAIPVIPVKAESSSVTYGAGASEEYTSLIRKIDSSFWRKQGNFNIIVGKTKSIKPILPEELDTNGLTITYKSSNKKIATVSKKGKVTAKKRGTVSITINIKDRYGSKIEFVMNRVIVVRNKAELKKVTAIQNMEDIRIILPTVKKGKKALIRMNYLKNRHLPDSDLNGYGPEEIKSISYKIKNSKIASVSKKGYITGKKKGKTKLTVTFKDIYGYTYSSTLDITVE